MRRDINAHKNTNRGRESSSQAFIKAGLFKAGQIQGGLVQGGNISCLLRLAFYIKCTNKDLEGILVPPLSQRQAFVNRGFKE